MLNLNHGRIDFAETFSVNDALAKSFNMAKRVLAYFNLLAEFAIILLAALFALVLVFGQLSLSLTSVVLAFTTVSAYFYVFAALQATTNRGRVAFLSAFFSMMFGGFLLSTTSFALPLLALIHSGLGYLLKKEQLLGHRQALAWFSFWLSLGVLNTLI